MNDESLKTNVIIEVAFRVKQFLEAKASLDFARLVSLGNMLPSHRWKPPDMNWINVNIDGSCVNGGKMTVCCGVTRDNTGHWI